MRSLLVFVSFSFLLIGCSPSESLLYQKWNINEVTFKGDLPEKDKQSTRQEFLALKTITFTSEHIAKLGDKITKEWKLDPKERVIYIFENGDTAEIFVRKLSKSKATLEGGGGKKRYTIHLGL